MSLESTLSKNDSLHFYIPLDFHFYHGHIGKYLQIVLYASELVLPNTQYLPAQSSIK